MPTRTPPARRVEEDAEILVHIAAPARVIDDSHYRSLAAAYLGFRPFSQACHVFQCNSNAVCEVDEESPRFLAAREGPRCSSPSSSELSFSDAWGNPKSPRLAVTSAHRHPANHPSSQASNGDVSLAESGPPLSTQQDSVVPPSEIPDSMPLNSCGILHLTSPNRVIEHFMQDLQAPLRCPIPLASLGTTIPTSPISPRTYPNATPATFGDSLFIPGTAFSDPGGEECRVVPVTTLVAKQATAPEVSTIGSNVDSVEDTVLKGGPVIIKKRAAPVTTSRAESEPISGKRSRPFSKDPNPGPLTRSTSDSGATEDHATAHPLVLKSTSTAFLSLLEIDAPEPPTGTGVVLPASLLTPNLCALASSLDLSRRFRPVESVRELRPFERGYWLVECSDWDGPLVRRTWGFLHNYVSQGLAGWGSRCVRDEDWKWIRLWCFGHVVGHLYLLLYLASERKLKTEGAKWIDGEGLVVLATDGHV